MYTFYSTAKKSHYRPWSAPMQNNWHNWANLQNFQASFSPATNIKETDEAYEIEIFIGKIDPKLIEVKIESEELVISYQDIESNEKGTWHRRDIQPGSFKKTYELPEEAIASEIKAKANNGYLNLTLPKKLKVSAQKIEIEI